MNIRVYENIGGYRVSAVGDAVLVEGVRDLDLTHTFECGQCFRWLRQPDGSYTGVVRGRVLNVSLNSGVLTLSNTTVSDFKNLWFEYFDLGRDYSAVKERVSRDDTMAEAVKYGWGIRLLKQDIWEVLISFIISANNRIPMIMKTISSLSEKFGVRLRYGGANYYSFPSPEKLCCCRLEELELCKAGFRCGYIIETSRMVKEGSIDLYALAGMDTDMARKELTRLPGVGNKVADCVLLYSGAKYDVFPTDVWIKRVVEQLYFKREASLREIQEFARDYFGEYAGFAQQYLYYYGRENKIGLLPGQVK